MPVEAIYLPVIRDSEMLDSFLMHLQNLKTKISIQLYIGAVFTVHLGLSIEDLLSTTVKDAAGKSFLYQKKGRILLYSDDFYAYLNDYIKSLPADCEMLFVMDHTPPYKRISAPYFSMSIRRAFLKFLYNGKVYDGNYSTLIRTFTYHFVLNYGSYDSYTIRGAKLYSARLSALSTLSKDEYQIIRETYHNSDFSSVLVPHAKRMMEEIEYYITYYPDCEPLKEKIAGLYKALYDLSECMDVALKNEQIMST